jgi:hypothetical protein
MMTPGQARHDAVRVELSSGLRGVDGSEGGEELACELELELEAEAEAELAVAFEATTGSTWCTSQCLWVRQHE